MGVSDGEGPGCVTRETLGEEGEGYNWSELAVQRIYSDPVTPAPSGRESGFARPSLTPSPFHRYRRRYCHCGTLPRSASQRPGKPLLLPPPSPPLPPSSSEGFSLESHTCRRSSSSSKDSAWHL
ncbi:uncharacterized protein LOC123507769 isoform X2 [Portunus trituberculatus]|uniref:uncharacterized protein LOC123507769 isoform X2 n=1 Tax=Portunus trituberculatus TaxID=210409 RepID=UPI001E1D143B|nr:uncharacterized protein LOC123507769 isoform X2 [Portunus trituberculatus]